MIIMSNLPQFSCRKLTCIHNLMSVMQLIRVKQVAVVMDLNGDVELNIITIAVEVKTMMKYDVAKGEHVGDK